MMVIFKYYEIFVCRPYILCLKKSLKDKVPDTSDLLQLVIIYLAFSSILKRALKYFT